METKGVCLVVRVADDGVPDVALGGDAAVFDDEILDDKGLVCADAG